MRRSRLALALGAVTLGGAGLFAVADDPPRPAASAVFPDSRKPPEGWSGPVFRLSQDYPATVPGLSPAPWRSFSFRTQSNDYLRAVLAYALEGNVGVDFRGQDNPVRKWYHAPWMHMGPAGREFMHGLTRERPSAPGALAPTQTGEAQNWAVSLYNPRGGHTLGQVWRNPNAPDPSKATFSEGSVAFKLIFTSAPVNQVPFLANSFEWQADIGRSAGTEARPVLRLLQVDVAVRERRADSTTGWVFGTFVYNGQAPGAAVWDRLVPVGVMWGNDPSRLNTGKPLLQTVINPQGAAVVPNLGFQGRLNGPVDNRRSSCLSCHSTAQIPADLSRPQASGPPPAGADASVLAQYFRNIRARTPFTPGLLPLDYSLQLQNGIVARARAGGLQPVAATARAAGPDRPSLSTARGVRVEPVER